MSAQKYLDMLRAIKDVAFATTDECGNPQVRIIDIMIAENEKLYFITARGKAFHRQITMRPFIAITGMTKDYVMIRLNGPVKKAPQEMLKQVFADNPSMNAVYPGESRNILDVFCMDEGCGELFDLGQHPVYRECFTLGSVVASQSGFLIDNTCIRCGLCKDSCPQSCIEEGTPYKIKGENCLHCGLCMEKCPADAIRKR